MRLGPAKGMINYTGKFRESIFMENTTAFIQITAILSDYFDGIYEATRKVGSCIPSRRKT